MRHRTVDPSVDPSVLTDTPRRGRGRGRQRAFASAVGSVIVVTATVAGAQWLAAGTGDGYAKARKAEPLRTVAAEAASSLYPGASGDLTLTVANDNPYDINLTQVAPNGSPTSGLAACDDPGNGVSFTTTTGTWLLPRGGTSTIVLAGRVSMAETSPDACQDQVFTIPVALTGAQRTGPPPGPRLTLTPTTAAFADQDVNTVSPPKQFIVKNVGAGATTDLTRGLSGPDVTSFIWGTSCSQLAPNATCTINVNLRPIRRGDLSAELRVSAAGQTEVATLTGRGVQAVIQIPGTDLGPVPVGTAKVMAIPVRNVGDGTTGPFGPPPRIESSAPANTFLISSSTCGAPLPPGAECSVTVRFTPQQPQQYIGSLVVVASPGTPQNGAGGAVAGQGVAPS